MPGDWKHKLCGCMNNIPGCKYRIFLFFIYISKIKCKDVIKINELVNLKKNWIGLAGAFCTPCYTCYLTCQMNETGLCCLSLFGNVLWPIRSYIRGKYDIPGSLCEDCLVTSCCPCCALCQLANEWQSRHSDVGVVFQQQTQVTTRVEERVHDTQPYYKWEQWFIRYIKGTKITV